MLQVTVNNVGDVSLGQVDFSSRLETTCNETDGARKFRRRRYYRSTWPDLEGPSRLESTWSIRLPGLDLIVFTDPINCQCFKSYVKCYIFFISIWYTIILVIYYIQK